MKRWSPVDGLSMGLLAFAAILTASVYDRLPDRLAVHFGAHGVANGFMPRATGAWVLLAVGFLTWLSLRVAPLVFPGEWKSRVNASPMAVVAFLITGLLVGLHVMILYAGLGRSVSLGGSLGIILGVAWLGLSFVLPRMRRNPLVGIRTPWSLASDENWARTHRFGGYTFAVGGVVAIFASLGGSGGVSMAALLGSGLLPAVYSFVIFRRAAH